MKRMAEVRREGPEYHQTGYERDSLTGRYNTPDATQHTPKEFERVI
jgi:hypothetical protein